MGRRVTPGSPEPLGVVPVGDGVNAAFPAPNAEAIELCLFDETGTVEEERIRLAHRTGAVFHAHVAGVAFGARYGLRVHGPFEPWRGHRFNPAKLLVDPWATRLDRPLRLDPLLFDARRVDAALPPDGADSAAAVPKAIVQADPAPRPDTRPRVPWDRTILYELGVKAFTALHPDVPEAQRGTFAGLGHPAVVGYLRDLGVTSVEILPAAAWIDERHLPALGLANAWGYNPIGFCAPDPRLAPGGWAEVRAAVEALHAAGLEVIVDVVLNHSGESDGLGPTLSLRGLDNAAYYRLRPDDPALYVNDAGCGNVLALDRSPALRLAMDALRTWARRGGVDGFRFDLAATLGRRPEGFDPDAPLLQAIAQDPVLRDLKLIAEPWDIGPGGYQPGRFPTGWGEWNDRYRDDVRRFWRGDGGMVGALATRLAGSHDLFAAKRRPSRGVNFVTAHDGFTLADLVSYEHKHNEANGEDNRDGTQSNHSWNHGTEGPTDDPAVAARRRADQRALLATLLLSRGTPMIAMGAEAGRTQRGNNNAYAQDNPLGWFDWSAVDHDLLVHARRLVALRQGHASLRDDRFLTGDPLPGETEPDVAWRRPDGAPMAQDDWAAADRALGCDRISRDADGAADRTYLLVNARHEPLDAALPWPRPGHVWAVVLDSAEDDGPDEPLLAEDRLAVGPRRVVLLAERAESGPMRRPAVAGLSDAALGRLAAAAGIAGEWWEETGVRHVVTPDTQRALLAAMGCPVATSADALDHLQALAHERDGRVLPCAVTMTAGRMVPLRLGRDAGTAGRLVLAPEQGERRIVSLAAARDAAPWPGVDGRSRAGRVIDLPELPEGRWQVTLEDHPDEPCALTVAPLGCHRPETWGTHARRFGLAAHLYALRRDGDQGIGDFTTLALAGRLAAERGAATLGLNPLHALFGQQRDRASPYQPSDRHFCDPISIDLAALGPLDPGGWVPPDGVAAGGDVDYPAVWALKRPVLEAAFARFTALPDDHGMKRDFAAFRRERGERLVRFAAFESLSAQRPGPWQDWPEDWRDPRRAVGLAAPQAIAFHAFLQFLCDRQLEAATDTGLPLGYYRDLAVGAAPDGAEIWASPAGYARGVSIGAPPDLFSRDGQVWMLPPPNPLVQERTGGADFAALVAANMRHAGALRIDHVMGLSRLFWVPDGAPASAGAYVEAPFHHLVGQLALESRRHRCLVVGEDLGTVQDGLRERLAEARVLSYRVLWFEREGDGFRAPGSWPAGAVACASTHDLPTIRGWWTAADIEERQALGLLDTSDAAAAREAREVEKNRLLEALAESGTLPAGHGPHGDLPEAVVLALHAFVAATPCVLALAQLDDLGRERVGVNLPGTDRERPNWRRRMALRIDDLFRDGFAQRVIDAIGRDRR